MGKWKLSLLKHLQDEQIQAISAGQQHVDRWAGEERTHFFHEPIVILCLKLQSTHAETSLDLKISQQKRIGGAAEVYTMPGCFHCQQVCCYQLLLLNPAAKTQHLDATVIRNVCRVAQQIPFFFILSFLSLKSALGFRLN